VKIARKIMQKEQIQGQNKTINPSLLCKSGPRTCYAKRKGYAEQRICTEKDEKNFI
jgi:hypothetical protein